MIASAQRHTNALRCEYVVAPLTTYYCRSVERRLHTTARQLPTTHYPLPTTYYSLLTRCEYVRTLASLPFVDTLSAKVPIEPDTHPLGLANPNPNPSQ